MDHDTVLKIKLDQLECHFTWALIKDDLDLPSVLNRLDEQLKLDYDKKETLARTYNALAYVKFLQGFLEETLSSLMTSVQLYKECHEEEFHKALIVTYGNLAWINYHMKNYTECESYLQKVQKINKNFSSESLSVPEVIGEKGWTFLKFSRKYYERAKECFKKALDLKPEDGELNAGYAIALYRTEYEEFTIENSTVIKQLRRAIETNPDDDVLKVLLAIRLSKYKRKKYREADSLVDEAIERSPDHPHVMRYAGKFFRYRGCVDRGIALLTKALEYSPNSSLTHHQLALCYKRKKIQLLQEGNHHARSSRVQQIRDQIIFHLEMATTHAPCFITAISDLALHYGEQCEIPRAEEMFQMIFKTAKEKNDNLHVVHFYYAEFQLYCNRREALAIKHYMECLKIHQDSPEGQKSARGLRKIAWKRIYKNTQDGEAYGILGFIHKEKGEKSQAVECYEKALSYGDNDEYLTILCALRLSIHK
ncbi:Interferon-induced protein with tetratricopeptide repeats 1 [Triplophysa tibetana]|uniref:Interferon-induced protein with tetratricopeptide repeats 1 n=1 Tax=Triplophysa tibetana TaxID=1572043 RepID=A0A5A9PU65_9TELE|nr:Interferon-induced protein with tetratricopeptide repeats 1 [Triplophysa tibetana]KAA0725338.1 Interferon-induced protein with tetratricopeptide repeats 1 [Triplophysa tibetana]